MREGKDPPFAGEEARCHTLVVESAETGQRLDRLLAGRLPNLTRSRLKILIEEGAVSSGGVTISEPSRRVKPGQVLALRLPAARPAQPQAQALPLTILYEDAELLVLDKPPGLVVHPAPGNPDRTLVNALLAHCGESLTGIGGVQRPGIVHRLDKDTSGLMVVAKNERAQACLSEQFAKRSVERRYLALVWGLIEPKEGEIAGAIGRHPRNRKKMAVVSRGGKAAVTLYRRLAVLTGGQMSLIECRLKTGRTHQIRVHLTHLGHPLVGDPLYGRATPARQASLSEEMTRALAGFRRQALHAASLGFRHPEGHWLSFEEEPPADLGGLIEILQRR